MLRRTALLLLAALGAACSVSATPPPIGPPTDRMPDGSSGPLQVLEPGASQSWAPVPEVRLSTVRAVIFPDGNWAPSLIPSFEEGDPERQRAIRTAGMRFEERRIGELPYVAVSVSSDYVRAAAETTCSLVVILSRD